MKKLAILTTVLFLNVWFTPQSDAAQQNRRDRDQVCFYQDIHYQGWEQCYLPGDEVPDLGRLRNNISSIRIYGRARVTVYDDDEYRGGSSVFGSDVPDLALRGMSGSRTWNDHIDSFRVSSTFNTPFPNNNPFPRGRQPDFVNDRVCVFEQSNYRGRSECWNAGETVRDLERVRGWNDRIRSIRVFGRTRLVVYRDASFRGEYLVVDRDISDLAVIRLRNGVNWTNQISSFEVQDEGNGRGRGRGRY